MIEAIELPETAENRYAMLGCLALRGQLRNQIDSFETLWKEFLEQPLEVSRLRLLRIHLRMLRSTVKVLEPLLPFAGKEWLEILKAAADNLGTIREYDVALRDCDKYSLYIGQEPVALKELLSAKRKEKTEAWLEMVEPEKIAEVVAGLSELLQNPRPLFLEEEALANAFLQARLQNWGMKLCNKLQNEVEKDDMEKLHAVRIKVKRFRYAYSAYMNGEADQELLMCLKNAQDTLGSIHDGSCNLAIMENLVAVAPNEQLAAEFTAFRAWRTEKLRQSLDRLPEVCTELVASLHRNIEGARLL